MHVTQDQVRYIASLARLHFSEDERVEMARQMSKILEYMDKLNELDLDGVAPMSHVLDLYNVTRPDVPNQRVTREQALSNAPDAGDAYFRVPKVID